MYRADLPAWAVSIDSVLPLMGRTHYVGKGSSDGFGQSHSTTRGSIIHRRGTKAAQEVREFNIGRQGVLELALVDVPNRQS